MAQNEKIKIPAKDYEKLQPLFAKLLEGQFFKNTNSNQENDVIETLKYPNDNADLTNVPGNTQMVDMIITNRNCDTIYVTLKYPSDKDEFMTLKYPSDSDEDLWTYKRHQQHSAITLKSQDRDVITLKYPSDSDELTAPTQDNVY